MGITRNFISTGTDRPAWKVKGVHEVIERWSADLTLYCGGNLLTHSSCKCPRMADKTAGGKYGGFYLHLVVGVQPMMDTGEDTKHTHCH